jgi:hypothetical protein
MATSWHSSECTILCFKFEPLNDGKRTKITLENEVWGELVARKGQGLSEWFTDEAASKIIEATSPERFANWIIDKRARKTTGARTRETYGKPIYHRPNFSALLRYLKLSKGPN